MVTTHGCAPVNGLKMYYGIHGKAKPPILIYGGVGHHPLHDFRVACDGIRRQRLPGRACQLTKSSPGSRRLNYQAVKSVLGCGMTIR